MKGNDHSHLLSCRLNQRRSDSEFRRVQSTWTNLLFEGWNNWTHHVLEYNLNSRSKLHIKEKGAGRTWYRLPAYAPTMNEAKAPGFRVQPRLHSKIPLKKKSLKGMGAREQQSEPLLCQYVVPHCRPSVQTSGLMNYTGHSKSDYQVVKPVKPLSQTSLIKWHIKYYVPKSARNSNRRPHGCSNFPEVITHLYHFIKPLKWFILVIYSSGLFHVSYAKQALTFFLKLVFFPDRELSRLSLVWSLWTGLRVLPLTFLYKPSPFSQIYSNFNK